MRIISALAILTLRIFLAMAKAFAGGTLSFDK
jgi:hypothetical protein